MLIPSHADGYLVLSAKTLIFAVLNVSLNQNRSGSHLNGLMAKRKAGKVSSSFLIALPQSF